jgi:hypothetical protein
MCEVSDASRRDCESLFEEMVESVGVKAFAGGLGLSTRQVYRMLNGVQPNPVDRFRGCLLATSPTAARQTLDFLCAEHGGYFAPVADDIGAAEVNAVKESAEAIVAITEGRSVRVTVKEIREAIGALAGLEHRLRG